MSDRSHVIILIHGIRDYALWQHEVRGVLERYFTVEVTNYGRFDLIRFLAPVPFFRDKAINRVSSQIKDIRRIYKDAQFSFVAHSFGTYILANILKREFDFTCCKIVFCGSVLNYDFPLEHISERFQSPVLNEVGARDVWPAFAESVTWGYGSSGTYGFRRPRARDRWHSNAGHGYFLNSSFCEKYWIPFFKDNTLVKATEKPESPPLWLRMISVFPIKYVILATALLLATPAIMHRLDAFVSQQPPGHSSSQPSSTPQPQPGSNEDVRRNLALHTFSGDDKALQESRIQLAISIVRISKTGVDLADAETIWTLGNNYHNANLQLKPDPKFGEEQRSEMNAFYEYLKDRILEAPKNEGKAKALGYISIHHWNMSLQFKQ